MGYIREFYEQFMKLDEQYRQHTAKLDEMSKTYDKLFEQILELETQLG